MSSFRGREEEWGGMRGNREESTGREEGKDGEGEVEREEGKRGKEEGAGEIRGEKSRSRR